MNLIGKAGLTLAVLATAGLASTAHAAITVTPTVTGAFNYAYSITPTDSKKSVSFGFNDPNVSFVSEDGPLNNLATGIPGLFVFVGSGGATLTAGSTETFNFFSTDPPKGTVDITAVGLKGGSADAVNNVIGPAPVPEASTFVSGGLLLGLGGMALAFRKRKAQAAA